MVDNAALVLQLRDIFLAELDEHAQSLQSDTMRLEKRAIEEREGPVSSAAESTADRAAQGSAEESVQEIVQKIFRIFHSLKGSARVVGYPRLESLCHHLEELLGDIRGGSTRINPEVIQILFDAADLLIGAGPTLKVNGQIEEERVSSICRRVDMIGSTDSKAQAQVQVKVQAEVTSSRPNNKSGQTVAAANDGTTVPVGERTRQKNEATSVSAPPANEKKKQASACSPSAREFLLHGENPTSYLRVSSDKLDRLIEKSSELLIASRRMENFHSTVTETLEFIAYWRRRTSSELSQSNNNQELSRALENIHHQVGQLSEFLAIYEHSVVQGSLELDVGIRGLRMLSFRQIAGLLQRTVRDAAKECGKIVEFRLVGEDVELDRSVLERLKDPLIHIVRNAIDHGIEDKASRIKAGKQGFGVLQVSVCLCGDRVDIEIRDDGRGVDVQKLIDKARSCGLEIPRELDQQLELVFHPGLTTANKVTSISGRGVGMEVVRTEVEAVGGGVVIHSQPGKGCCITLRVPLTLTVTTALVFESGTVTFAIPSANVLRLQRISRDSIHCAAGIQIVESTHGQLSMATLDEILELPSAKPELNRSKLTVVTLSLADREVGICVDRAVDEREVVVKSLGSQVGKLYGIIGGTIMPNGSVALILSADEIMKIASKRRGRGGGARLKENGDQVGNRLDQKPKCLLVVDDSVTIRSMQKAVLEGDGYEVILSSDGEEAWNILQRRNIDLVVSDIDMPVMDGIALTRTIRGSKRHAHTPVVLVTSRDSEIDRERGAEAGANAYLVKKEFDNKRLLEAVRRQL